jgi:hypothetical protein
MTIMYINIHRHVRIIIFAFLTYSQYSKEYVGLYIYQQKQCSLNSKKCYEQVNMFSINRQVRTGFDKLQNQITEVNKSCNFPNSGSSKIWLL